VKIFSLTDNVFHYNSLTEPNHPIFAYNKEIAERICTRSAMSGWND